MQVSQAASDRQISRFGMSERDLPLVNLKSVGLGNPASGLAQSHVWTPNVSGLQQLRALAEILHRLWPARYWIFRDQCSVHPFWGVTWGCCGVRRSTHGTETSAVACGEGLRQSTFAVLLEKQRGMWCRCG